MEDHKKIKLFGQRDFSENFDMSLNFIKQNYAPIIRAVAILIPILLIAVFLMPNTNKMAYDVSSYNNPLDIYGEIFTVGYFIALILYSFTPFAIMLFTISYMSIYSKSTNGEVDTSEAWRKVAKAFLPLLGAGIIFAILLTIGFIFCVIPGIIIYVYLGFFAYAYISEDLGIIESFQRSYDLVRGNWWVTFGFGVVWFILIMVGSLIFAIPSYLSALGTLLEIDFLIGDIYHYISTSIASLAYLFLYPVMYMAMGVMYFSHRNEVEGVDMEDEIDTIGTYNNQDTRY